jgi:hypothetical protein
MRLSVRLLLLSTLVLAPACNDDDSFGPLDRPHFELELASEAVTIPVGDSVLVLPGLHDPKGDTAVNDPVFWFESDDTDVADISYENDGDGPGAYIVGYEPGETLVQVAYRGAVDLDTVLVTVTEEAAAAAQRNAASRAGPR